MNQYSEDEFGLKFLIYQAFKLYGYTFVVNLQVDKHLKLESKLK